MSDEQITVFGREEIAAFRMSREFLAKQCERAIEAGDPDTTATARLYLKIDAAFIEWFLGESDRRTFDNTRAAAFCAVVADYTALLAMSLRPEGSEHKPYIDSIALLVAEHALEKVVESHAARPHAAH